MSMQPYGQQPYQPPPPPGWYPAPGAPGVQRYWDGQQWTDHVAATGPQVVHVTAQPAPYQLQPAQHVSGLTTGGHVMHAILTVCTCGLWGIVWALRAFFGRRRIG